MIIPTFASIKHHKEVMGSGNKNNISSKFESIPASFKEIRQRTQANQPKSAQNTAVKKRLENQQNTFSNVLQDQGTDSHRKNLVKAQKSIKKINHGQLYKSPSHKAFQINALHLKDRAHQLVHYCPKILVPRIEQLANNVMTPHLSKTNRSYARDEDPKNASFLTQKMKTLQNSEHGSISISSKASFEDSFHRKDFSYEDEQRQLRQCYDVVNSSVEVLREQPKLNRTINQFTRGQNQCKNMKKSINFFCSNNQPVRNSQNYLKDSQQKSINSSVCSKSMKFTQMFGHYRKQHHQANQSIKINEPAKHIRVYEPIRSNECPQVNEYSRASQPSSKYQFIKKSDPLILKQLNLKQFELGRQIGCGKYGKVHLAIHKQLGFICALKQVSKKIIRDQKLQIPFMRQIKIQMYLSHPNIVKLYGYFHDENNIYLVMEYCSDGHLFKLIRQKKQFQQQHIIQILGNIFQAVSFMHCHGVIHRDLKPQNIVIQHGVYKLCDFGWAAYACGENRTTFCGTPLYVCPEVLKGEQYNTKADIWGLGVIMYQLNFGQVPFSILSQSDLMKIIKDTVHFPTWTSISQKLVPIIRSMLSKDPEVRPSLSHILSSQVFRSFNENLKGPLQKELQTLF